MYNLILAFIAMFLLSACGSGSGTGSSDTGAISFNVDWDRQSAESVKSAIRASSDVCSDYGIETIHASVFNSSNSEIASMDWTCSAHSGSITSVPVGSNYTVYLQGLDSSGTITWQGSVTGISVTANTTASAGTITMTYIGSDSTPPYIVSFDPLQDATDVPVTTTITATFNVGMASSTINTDTFTLFDYGTNSYVSGSVTYDSSTMTATFTPSANLSYGTMYMANMQAGSNGVLDYKGWGIIGTSYVQFTTEDEPTSAPSAPTGVSAAAGDSEVEISWTAVSGATSYNIYWSNSTGVTKTNGTQITGATSPYNHTGLTNGTIYYYVVTAVNSYGESGESSQVSGTSLATTVQALVVAGGGGGGGNDFSVFTGAGGGAGGYLYNSAFSVSVQTYLVTVGDGGLGGVGRNYGQNGGNSIFSSMTAIGGGGGAWSDNGSNHVGNTGGSGGGSSDNFTSGGLGTAGQGNNGGAAGAGNAYASGGGGGSSSAGGDSGDNGGNGGNGTANSISGSSVTYAGGGGGGCGNSGWSGGTGGSGGGGNGGSYQNNAGANASPANRGSGGGGASGNTNGGSGSSGIVIIRYTTGSINATGGTITYSGGDTIHTFTTSGTFTVN